MESVVPEDEGEYRCDADNGVGTVTATAMLTVHCKFFFKSFFLDLNFQQRLLVYDTDLKI